jgi:hypothetical protein
VRRAETWTVSGGADYTGKPRPGVIVKDDHSDTDSVTLCPWQATSHNSRKRTKTDAFFAREREAWARDQADLGWLALSHTGPGLAPGDRAARPPQLRQLRYSVQVRIECGIVALGISGNHEIHSGMVQFLVRWHQPSTGTLVSEP